MTNTLIIKVIIKNLCNLSNEKNDYSFILNYKGVGEEECSEQGERGNIIEIT